MGGNNSPDLEQELIEWQQRGDSFKGALDHLVLALDVAMGDAQRNHSISYSDLKLYTATALVMARVALGK